MFYIKHKDITVCRIDIDYNKLHISEVFDFEHLPPILKGMQSKLEEWFNARMLASIKVKDIEDQQKRNKLILKTKALNLSDCYWVTDNLEDKWSDVNLFDNNYKNLLPLIKTGEEQAVVFPVDKINGWREKGWCIYKGSRYLFKTSNDTRDGYTDNDREIVLQNIFADFGIRTCHYSLLGQYVINPTESNSKDRELITAKDFYIQEFGNEDCILEQLYSKLRPDIVDKINDLIIVDHIVNQKDRHYRNFGFLRNPDTLEILDLYPIYDNGGCFYYEDEPKHYSRIIHTSDEEIAKHIYKSKLLDKDKLRVSLEKNIKNKIILEKCIKKLEVLE